MSVPATDPDQKRGNLLLQLARGAIAGAVGHPERGVEPDMTADDAAWLAVPGACFVTLTEQGRLRGCIGSLEAFRPLREDIQANARAAAMCDSRFPPLGADEFDAIAIEVSLLSSLEPLVCTSEADVLACLRPGVDGVILDHGQRRGTFLPQVWKQLPDRAQFMAQLKQKAGLPANFWSKDITLHRYTVRKWAESGQPGERRGES